jgi:cell division protein ZapA
MVQVNVTINDKHYRMACDDGEEAHLAGLAERLNASIEALRERFGEIGDQRLTVMAAITFADQAAEAQRRIAQLEHQLTEAENARLAARERENLHAERTADAIVAVAERIESLAGRVGGGGASVGGNGSGGITIGNGRHNGAS